MEDVLGDNNVDNKVGKNERDLTHWLSIEGVYTKKLSMARRRKFCQANSITGYKNLAKTRLCNVIVERMKTRGLDDEMYPDDFNKKPEKTKKLPKNAKPLVVTKDGS